MSFPQTVRYSTLVRLVFPLVLVSLLVTIFTLVVLDLVFTISQGLDGPSSRGHQYEPRERQINKKHSSIETFILGNRAALQAGSSSVMMSGEEKDSSSKQIRDDIIIRDKINELKGHQQHHQFPGIQQKPINVTLDREFFNYLAGHLRDTPYPGIETYVKYSVARMGLTPLVNVESLIPAFGPVINDVLSFKYPISVPPCREHVSSMTNRTIFVAVISATGNFDKRNIIRQTWKNHLHQHNTENDDGQRKDAALVGIAGFAFVLGRTDDKIKQKKIEEEAKIYGDIIQIGMRDFYRNLSLKGIALLNWVNRNCAGKIDFFVKVDDDVYVNVRNLAHFVQSRHQQQSGRSIFGVGKPRFGWPDRDDKWVMSFEEWPWNQYPSYILGAIVLISGNSILPLLAACQTTPIMAMEDVYFYGICTEKAGIENHYSTGPTRSLIDSILRAPTTYEVHMWIAWRVDFHDFAKFQQTMNSSHQVVDRFYCKSVSDASTSENTNGEDTASVDYTKPIYHFKFITVT